MNDNPPYTLRHAAGPAYAELQATSNFSFLRGASHPEELAERAKELGLTALAIVDRNSLAGVVRGHVAAKKAGLRYVVGCRLDLTALDQKQATPRKVTDHQQAPQKHNAWARPTIGLHEEDRAAFTSATSVDVAGSGPAPQYLPLSYLCYPKDRAAYGRLCRLLSLGKGGDTPKGECHISLTDLCAHKEEQVLVALAPDTWFQPTFSVSQAADALSFVAKRLAPTPLFLAASHAYRGDDRARIAKLAAIASAADLTLIATGDVHYHDPERRPLQDVVTAIREHTTVAKAGFLLHPNQERHLKSPPEMARLFQGFNEAVAATTEIVDQCPFSLDELRYNYPNEPVPPGKTPQDHLEALTFEGAEARYPNGVPDAIKAVLTKELRLIKKLNYAPYFLTVHDIVRWARSQAILCQGRGSAANSAVCYCLFITSIDPTEIDLLFERFISEERKEPPDIDVDFEHERREEVMQYIYARYGRERAGIAATVITYRSRSAVREVAKALGLSEDVQGALAGSIWGWSDKGLQGDRARQAGLDPTDPLILQTIELTRDLVGFPRHLSQHVGGFVLTEDPLVEVVPVGNAAMENRTFVEWDKDDLDALGILKIDVLALGMLTCIRKALALMKTHHGEARDLASFFPATDQATYDMLCEADSLGVFQVESRAQMNMLPRLKPREFYDLVIEVAIVRPGPIQGDMVHPYLRRRDGLEPVDYPAPAPDQGPPDELQRILKKTLGVPLFQEQAMKIAIDAARFSPDEANELRHAMATFRRRGTIDRLQAKMVGRMVERGYDPEFAARCFNQVKGFGEYGFPESHSASFALLVYVSSWIKCHYPAVFCAALLNAQPMGFYAPAQIVRDARAHGVEVRSPDINFSDWDSTLEPSRLSHKKRAVRLGLRQVKGLSAAHARAVIDARQTLSNQADGNAKGIFSTIEDLYLAGGLSVSALEKLAAADAFRSLGLDRRAALWAIKALPDTNALPLFAVRDVSDQGPDAPVALPDLSLGEHVVDDYQAMRLSVKAHPLSFLRRSFEKRGLIEADDLRRTRNNQAVAVAGLIIVRQRPGTASGVVFMTMEDETGIVNAIVWPKVMETYRAVVMGSRMIMARGRVQRAGDIIHLVVSHMEDWSHELLKLSSGEAELPFTLARADEVVRPTSDPRVTDPLARYPTKRDDEDEGPSGFSEEDIAIVNAFEPAPSDRAGPTKPLRHRGRQNWGTQNWGSQNWGTRNGGAQNGAIQNQATQNLGAQNQGEHPKQDASADTMPAPQERMPPFSYGMHPRTVRNLIPKGRDFR